MDRQFFILALAAALSVLLVIAAATDIRSRIISNRLNIAIAALAPLFWLANGLAPWPDMLLQIIFDCIIFGLFPMIFATGMMGGGEVKVDRKCVVEGTNVAVRGGSGWRLDT